MLNVSFISGRQGPFRLRQTRNGVFQIHSPRGAFEGTKLMIFSKAVQLGVLRQDLRVAVSEMNKLGHDVAEFGIGGRFMFTLVDAKKMTA